MDELLRELIDVLDLEEEGGDTFAGRSEPDRHGAIYGGQFVAQALVAAARTAEGRVAHSLHAFFLRGGDPGRSLRYAVERVRDGRSFSHRRVSAWQDDHELFTAQLCFQPPEEGFEHQIPMPEDAPDPESLSTPEELGERVRDSLPAETSSWAVYPRAIEMRHWRVPANLGGRGEARNFAWFRARSPVGEEPLLHQALIAYTSDMSLNDNSVRPHARPGRLGVRMASLDHCVWFHAPARCDDWLLFAQHSPRAAGARGYVQGTIFTRAGEMVASVAQECLLRPSGEEGGAPFVARE